METRSSAHRSRRTTRSQTRQRPLTFDDDVIYVAESLSHNPVRRRPIRLIQSSTEPVSIIDLTCSNPSSRDSQQTTTIDLTSVPEDDSVLILNTSRENVSEPGTSSQAPVTNNQSPSTSGVSEVLDEVLSEDSSVIDLEQMETQPTEPPISVEAYEESIPKSEAICLLCYKSFRELQSKGVAIDATACGHIYCSDCIRPLVRGNRKFTCLVCKRSLKKASLAQLFIQW